MFSIMLILTQSHYMCVCGLHFAISLPAFAILVPALSLVIFFSFSFLGIIAILIEVGERLTEFFRRACRVTYNPCFVLCPTFGFGGQPDSVTPVDLELTE